MSWAGLVRQLAPELARQALEQRHRQSQGHLSHRLQRYILYDPGETRRYHDL